MDLYRTLTGPTVAASESNDSANNVAINSVVTDLTMGNQSQLRNGTIINVNGEQRPKQSGYTNEMP
jgi:hypothetical protein